MVIMTAASNWKQTVKRNLSDQPGGKRSPYENCSHFSHAGHLWLLDSSLSWGSQDYRPAGQRHQPGDGRQAKTWYEQEPGEVHNGKRDCQ